MSEEQYPVVEAPKDLGKWKNAINQVQSLPDGKAISIALNGASAIASRASLGRTAKKMGIKITISQRDGSLLVWKVINRAG